MREIKFRFHIGGKGNVPPSTFKELFTPPSFDFKAKSTHLINLNDYWRIVHGDGVINQYEELVLAAHGEDLNGDGLITDFEGLMSFDSNADGIIDLSDLTATSDFIIRGDSTGDRQGDVVKVVGDSVDIFKMQMRWSSFDQNSISLSYQDNKRIKFRERVKNGAAFFVKEGADFKERFVLAAAVSKKVGPNGRQQDAYEVEDTTPRYKGTPKQNFTLFRKGPKPQGYNEIQDRSVTLTLHALGQEGSSFVVKELERFSLPYDAEAKNRPYQVTKVEPAVGQPDVFTVEIVGTHNGEIKSETLTVRKK